LDLIMQIRIADVERMNCDEEAKREEEAIIDVSSPLLLFCVGPKYIQKNKQRKQPVKDVVAQSTSLMVGKLNVESFLERVKKGYECI